MEIICPLEERKTISYFPKASTKVNLHSVIYDLLAVKKILKF